jgi:hypothetical protein
MQTQNKEPASPSLSLPERVRDSAIFDRGQKEFLLGRLSDLDPTQKEKLVKLLDKERSQLSETERLYEGQRSAVLEQFSNSFEAEVQKMKGEIRRRAEAKDDAKRKDEIDRIFKQAK